jgi:CRISPR/Cas system CSM-associated protein Csm2 small subunit
LLKLLGLKLTRQKNFRMATGKKSFIAYADWKATFNELPNEEAGMLIKHIFAYVNDENPETDSILIKAVFANIKATLKRDLKKWEKQQQQRVEAGLKSAEIRKRNATLVNGRSVSSTVSVSVNVNDINKSLLSEVKTSDVPEDLKEYYKIALEFQKLFIKNQRDRDVKPTHQLRATFKNYVDPIRLILQQDEATTDDLRDIYDFLNSNEGTFWKENILSTSKLREKLPTLLMQARKPKPIKQKN